MVVEEDGEVLQTRPRPNGGTPINESDQSELRRRFARFSPSDVSLSIAVWDDSFEHFRKVKAAAVDAGFEYRLILMKDGQTLVDRGGRDGRVQ